MRIAFFTDTFPPEVNGVANTAERAARMLAERGHTMCVYTVSRLSREVLRQKTGNAFAIETIPSFGLPIYLGVRTTIPFGISKRAVARFKPDIIHAHTPFSVGWEAVWAARSLGVPLVGTHHTFFDHYLKHIHLDHEWARRLSWKLTVAYYNRCDLVVSPTRSLADALVKNGLKRPHEIIPNTVDTKFFRPAADADAIKSRLGLPKKVIVHMGRLSYEKSVDQAIRAFKLISESEPDTFLVVIGDGPGKHDLESLANELGLASKIRFTGFIYGERLVEYLQASDIFVTASKSENMPLALLESMAVGLPIVAVRSLGLTEMIKDGGNGYLLPPDDSAAIAQHTLKLLRDDALRGAFSASSRDISETYAERAISGRFEDLYSRLISQHSRL